MKKLKTISITIILTLLIFSTVVFANTGIVNAPSGLVLRAEPSTSGSALATVPNNSEVNITGESGNWYKATYNNLEGYLFGEYVNVKEEVSPEQTSEEPDTSKDTITTNKLKVYVIPVITSTVINEIEPNVPIKVEKQITKWSYITAGEISGWVRTYAIGQTSQEETVPTVETPQEEPKQEEPKQPTNDEEQTESQNDNKPSNNEQTETAVSNMKGFVNVDYANVRKEATTNSAIITTLTKNTSFEINAETEEWYKIKYTSPSGEIYEGYIYKELTTK